MPRKGVPASSEICVHNSMRFFGVKKDIHIPEEYEVKQNRLSSLFCRVKAIIEFSKKNPISSKPDIGFTRYLKVLSHYQAGGFRQPIKSLDNRESIIIPAVPIMPIIFRYPIFIFPEIYNRDGL